MPQKRHPQPLIHPRKAALFYPRTQPSSPHPTIIPTPQPSSPHPNRHSGASRNPEISLVKGCSSTRQRQTPLAPGALKIPAQKAASPIGQLDILPSYPTPTVIPDPNCHSRTPTTIPAPQPSFPHPNRHSGASRNPEISPVKRCSSARQRQTPLVPGALKIPAPKGRVSNRAV